VETVEYVDPAVVLRVVAGRLVLSEQVVYCVGFGDHFGERAGTPVEFDWFVFLEIGFGQGAAGVNSVLDELLVVRKHRYFKAFSCVHRTGSVSTAFCNLVGIRGDLRDVV
jgi:hypothetical protein